MSPRLFAADYHVYILDIPIVSVSMESVKNSISFHTETLGIFHSIWPVDNHYFTKYDSLSFGIREYRKSIHQGSYKGELSCTFDSNASELIYNRQSIVVIDSIQNIFTILARLSYQSVEELDTKWFFMNHEGSPQRARLLWVDAEILDIDNTNILCDHYRLDIEEVKGESIQVSPWDYFTDHISSSDAIRQVWVEQNEKRRIIKATVSIFGMTVKAEIQNK